LPKANSEGLLSCKSCSGQPRSGRGGRRFKSCHSDQYLHHLLRAVPTDSPTEIKLDWRFVECCRRAPNAGNVIKSPGSPCELVTDPETLRFWHEEYPSYTKQQRAEAAALILNKAGQFTASPHLRLILGQVAPRFDQTASSTDATSADASSATITELSMPASTTPDTTDGAALGAATTTEPATAASPATSTTPTIAPAAKAAIDAISTLEES
jgi:hypothetical protein